MKRAWLLALLAVGCSGLSTPVSETEKPSEPVVKTTLPEKQIDPVKPERPSHNRIYALTDLSRGKVKLPTKTIDAWIMDDDSKRAEGMMWLQDEEVKPEQGMLFAFPDEAPRGFWMQNTLIPLDIVYIASSGKVVSIAHGKAEDETSLPSTGPAQYVLEVKEGQAEKLGIKPGVVLGIPKTTPK